MIVVTVAFVFLVWVFVYVCVSIGSFISAKLEGGGRGFELEAFSSGQLPGLRHHNWSYRESNKGKESQRPTVSVRFTEVSVL